MSESAFGMKYLWSLACPCGSDISYFYKMLKCNIGVVDKNDTEFQSVVDILTNSEGLK